MKIMSRLLTVALFAGLLSSPISVASSVTAQERHDDDAQPHMQAALDALNQAKQHLQEAMHDKGGHRAAALKAVDDAIRHVQMGMKAGDNDRGKRGDKDHDHDKK